MSVSKMLYLLAQGFIIGFGPCLAICIPVIVPIIAGTKKTWKEGLVATLYFSLTRLFVYVMLGGVSGYIGAFLISYYYNYNISYYVWSVGAGILILIGFLIVIGTHMDFGFCHRMSKDFLIHHPAGSMIILGFLVGISPCLPLIGILLEIALLAHNFVIGAMYGLLFGIGTVLSPILLVGALTPLIGGRLHERSAFVYRLFTILCGLTMIALGVYIIFYRGIV